MVYQLVYISRATGEMNDQQLGEILSIARSKNATVDVSGMLLYQSGSFIQVLEGDEADVDRIFAKIEGDSRHSDAQVLLRGHVEERAFDGWSMGYLSGTQLSDIPEGFHPFLRSGFRRKTEQDEMAARKALEAFKEGRWRLS